jgi:hypothetical protein
VRRIAHHALTLASTLLFTATSILWLRSYSRSELLRWNNAAGYRALYTARGSLAVDLTSTDRSAYPQEFHGPVYFTDSPHPPFNYLDDLSSETGDRPLVGSVRASPTVAAETSASASPAGTTCVRRPAVARSAAAPHADPEATCS